MASVVRCWGWEVNFDLDFKKGHAPPLTAVLQRSDVSIVALTPNYCSSVAHVCLLLRYLLGGSERFQSRLSYIQDVSISQRARTNFSIRFQQFTLPYSVGEEAISRLLRDLFLPFYQTGYISSGLHSFIHLPSFCLYLPWLFYYLPLNSIFSSKNPTSGLTA